MSLTPMKIKNHQRKKRLIYFLLCLSLAVSIYIVYLQYFKTTDDQYNKKISDTNYTSPTADQITTGNEIKHDTVERKGVTDDKNATFTNELPTPVVNNGILQIHNLINGVYSSGTCELTLHKNGNAIVKTAPIHALPQSSTCEGFNIPVSELSTGMWQIYLDVTIGDKTIRATATAEI